LDFRDLKFSALPAKIALSLISKSAIDFKCFISKIRLFKQKTSNLFNQQRRLLEGNAAIELGGDVVIRAKIRGCNKHLE